MTYSSGGPGYTGAQQPGAYAQTTEIPKVDAGPSKLPLYLLIGVAVLGLAAYLLCFGPIWKGDAAAGSTVTLGVLATLFAGLFAVVGLLPKQGNYTGVVSATAIAGFLLTIFDLISHAKGAGWALIVIVVVAALQTVLAIAALLMDAGVISPPAPRPKYDPYQQYAAYYGQQPGQQPQFAQPQQGVPQQPPSAGPQSYSQPQGFPQYGGYPGGPPSGPFQAAAPAGASPGGPPTVYAGGPPAGGYPGQGHAAGPPTPPTGFPTFAPPPSQQPAQDQSTPSSSDQPTQKVSLEQQDTESPAPPPA
ncbi:MAG: hypothetical protein QOH57_4286 [Mycobacterium sp.]|jgi:hypothetical protein|nr:hypothetical protein [Mycobacterium sp.]